jgi:hypothetical protein
MSQNYGNRHASLEKRTAIAAALSTFIGELDDALSPLSASQRKGAVRMGDGSVAFLEKAIEVGKNNPELLRRGFDIAEVERDLDSRAWLHALELQLTQTLELVRNAVIAHGSDAMVGGLEIYASVKDDEGDGVNAMRKLLGKRFERAGHKDVPAPVSA